MILFVVGFDVDVQVLMCLVFCIDGRYGDIFVSQQCDQMFVGSVVCWENGGCGVVKMCNGVSDINIFVVGFEYWCGVLQFIFGINLWCDCCVIERGCKC